MVRVLGEEGWWDWDGGGFPPKKENFSRDFIKQNRKRLKLYGFTSSMLVSPEQSADPSSKSLLHCVHWPVSSVALSTLSTQCSAAQWQKFSRQKYS